MEYDVRLETLGPLPLAVVRRRASVKELPKVVPDACGVVWKVIRAKGVAGAGRHIAVYLDDQINLEVGVELEAPLGARGDGELIGSATPAGPVATAVHFGPYGGLHAAHHAIRQWCAAHGHITAGPNWEIYGHWLDAWTNDPSQIRTLSYFSCAALAWTPVSIGLIVGGVLLATHRWSQWDELQRFRNIGTAMCAVGGLFLAGQAFTWYADILTMLKRATYGSTGRVWAAAVTLRLLAVPVAAVTLVQLPVGVAMLALLVISLR